MDGMPLFRRTTPQVLKSSFLTMDVTSVLFSESNPNTRCATDSPRFSSTSAFFHLSRHVTAREHRRRRTRRRRRRRRYAIKLNCDQTIVRPRPCPSARSRQPIAEVVGLCKHRDTMDCFSLVLRISLAHSAPTVHCHEWRIHHFKRIPVNAVIFGHSLACRSLPESQMQKGGGRTVGRTDGRACTVPVDSVAACASRHTPLTDGRVDGRERRREREREREGGCFHGKVAVPPPPPLPLFLPRPSVRPSLPPSP